jgi:hypothetical protein
MPGLGDYGFVEWTPRCQPREAATPEVSSGPETMAVLLRALLPFREAREAVVRALRESAGLPPMEPLWTG